jgi:hypothetical protein
LRELRPERFKPRQNPQNGVHFRLQYPHILFLSEWQPPRREPKKTKAELREMLAKAVRNTAQPAPKPPPKAKRDRG